MELGGLLGSVVPIQTGNKYIYNLITKKNYQGKPTKSLMTMHMHAVGKGVPGICMPMIGSGLDHLNFCHIFKIICEILVIPRYRFEYITSIWLRDLK